MKKRPVFKGFTETKEDYFNAAKKGKILRIGLQIDTPPCNWKCPYCYASDSPNTTKVETSPVKDMLGWIDQGIDLGATGLTINGTFEPTLGKDLFTFLEYSVEKGLNTMLVTNGSGLTKDKIKRIKELGISVMMKLNVPIATKDDPRFEEYRKLQAFMSGYPENSNIYQNILEKLEMLIDAGFNEEIKQGETIATTLGLESVIVKSNIKYLRKLSKQLRDKNIYSHLEVVKVQGSCKDNPTLSPTVQELKKMFNEILSDDLADGYSGFSPHPPYVGGSCYQNLIRLNIAANGDVKPCPGIDLTLGNLKDNTMKEIIENSEVLDIVRNLEEKIQGDCKSCIHMKERECYAGCRGTAYQEMKAKGYTDAEALVASDPGCWKVNSVLD